MCTILNSHTILFTKIFSQPIIMDFGEKQQPNVYSPPKACQPTIVFDNGTYEFKAGYLKDLCMIVRNRIYKHKEKVSFEPFPMSSIKSMFDNDVIVNFDVLEYTMDNVLSYLKPSKLKNLIFTITPFSPTEAELLEFLFEVYKFEKIQLGYDFIYCYHLYFERRDCVIVDLKYSSVTVSVIKDSSIKDIYKISFGGKDLQNYINYAMVDKYKETRRDYRGLVGYIRVSDDYFKESLEIYHEMCSGIYDRNLFLSDKKEEDRIEKEAKKIKKITTTNSNTAMPSIDYFVLNAPDESLDKDQLKEKKRLKMILYGALARIKSKTEKTFAMFDEVIDSLEDEVEKLSNFPKYVSKKKEKFNAMKRELELRDQLRRDCKNKKTREFMIKFKEGALTEEEQHIKSMILDAEDEDQESVLITRINQMAAEILALDPDFIPFYANTVEILRGDNIGRQCVNIELIKWPEIWFDPSIIGSDQMGLGEIFENIYSEHQIENVLLCGGFSFMKNLEKRIHNEICCLMRNGNVNVVKAKDAQKDPFGGARFSDLLPTYHREDFEKIGAFKLVEAFKNQ